MMEVPCATHRVSRREKRSTVRGVAKTSPCARTCVLTVKPDSSDTWFARSPGSDSSAGRPRGAISGRTFLIDDLLEIRHRILGRLHRLDPLDVVRSQPRDGTAEV